MSKIDAHLKTESLLLHGGQESDPTTGSRAVPIYQTTSYQFRDTDHAANLFGLKESGNIYTRLMNPTTDVLERRMALIDHGIGALAVASGQSAITLALLNIARAGDEIVSMDNLYGGTYTLFHYTFKRMGIEVKFVKSNDLDALKKAITPKTKAVYAESIGNPKLDVADLEGIARIAHDNRIPFVLDNTVSPYLLKPFDHGVDITVYSATKFIGGHGTSIGGIIVDSGKFDWKNGKFPLITEPDPSYHGLNFFDALGSRPISSRQGSYCSATLDRHCPPSTRSSSSRAWRHCICACPGTRKTPWQWQSTLEKHPKVAWVDYPGLTSSPEYPKVKKYLTKGAGAIIGFGIKGGAEAGKRFINSLQPCVAPGEHRGCKDPCHTSGNDNASAALGSRTARHRGNA